jgi:DNA polymerase III alpha subunit
VLDNQAGFYPPQVYIEEARRLGLQLLTPDVNRSAAGTQARGRALRLGLGAIKGLRRDTVQALLVARRDGGSFVSLRDLLTRVPLSKAEITTLIEVGALDRVADDRSRPELLWQARLWLPAIERARERASSTGQGRLPLLEPLPELPPTMPALQPYSPTELLNLEQAALGCTVSANPMTPYAAQLARYNAIPASDLATHAGKSVVVGGLPVAVRRHLTHAGEWMLFLTLQDQTNLLEVVVMPDSYAAALPTLAGGGPIVARGQVEVADHGGAIVRATRLRPLRRPAESASSTASEAAAALTRLPVP